jgi:GAF domain-containing protein
VTDPSTELLQSIVAVARAVFGARAASIAVLDEAAGRFTFAAVSGAGEGELVGSSYDARRGIAGAAAATGEPLVIDDLGADRRFARDVAESTGYVPDAIMVTPLLRGERTLGVLSVLDRQRLRSGLEDLRLLEAFGTQAALALELGVGTRADGEGERLAEARRLVSELGELLA